MADELAAFEASTQADQPPAGLSPALAALWWERKGDWARSHDLVAADEGSRALAWVHAYLHRQEGDADNARYWYRRAGQPVERGALDLEWRAIAAALLAKP